MGSRPVFAYENEDGDVYVPVAVEPDEGSAAQRYADQTGLIVVSEGRVTVRTQDCECYPPSDHCPDADGEPCTVTERNEVWHFTTWPNDDHGRRDLAYDLGDEQRQTWVPS